MAQEQPKTSSLLIFVPDISPRVEFIFDFIFHSILGITPEFTTNQNHFLVSEKPKINYSSSNFTSGLFIKAHSLLFEKSIEPQEIDVVGYRNNQLFFASSDDSFLPFDPFACTFYLISRYEEYLSESTDEHDRFFDNENILVKLGLYQKPVVDQITFWIAGIIEAQFSEFKCKRRTFSFVTSIDIDNAWAFRNKSLMVSVGAILKAFFHGRWDELKQRTEVLLHQKNDPYDTYKYILDTYQGLLSRVRFFILIGDRNRYGKNISYRNKQFKQLITNLSSVCELGIHPSYESNNKPWLFETEKKRLENIIQKPVTQSRQHYLKLKMPQTYQHLQKSGISGDYTMGFASLAGFRAGTCSPFPFFDLSMNTRTELMIHPFQLMDVSLKSYMKLKPEQAWLQIEKILTEVKNVEGTFISLWHNESLRESGQWLGWRKVFEQVLETCLKFEHEPS